MSKYDIEENFKEFCDFLKLIKELDENKDYENLKERIPTLNDYLKSIIEKSEDRLREKNLTQENLNEIVKKINKFYDNFIVQFPGDRDQLFAYLFNDNKTSQTYRRKIYLLNHLCGYIEKKAEPLLGNKIEFKMYMISKYYVDYYESFGIFLEPFLNQLNSEEIKKYIEEQNKNRKNQFQMMASNYYYYFRKFIVSKNKGLKFWDFNKYFDTDLRNLLAHGYYFIEKNQILEYKRSGKKLELITHSLAELEEKCKFIRNFAVIFTTKFDLLVNQILRDSIDNKIDAYWSSYFKYYYKSWEDFHIEFKT